MGQSSSPQKVIPSGHTAAKPASPATLISSAGGTCRPVKHIQNAREIRGARRVGAQSSQEDFANGAISAYGPGSGEHTRGATLVAKTKHNSNSRNLPTIPIAKSVA